MNDFLEKKRYSYKWTPLSQPEGSSGTVSENQGGTLKLSHLTEGLYTFKVTVSAPGEFGETEANVTVLPRKIFDFYIYFFILKLMTA